MTQFKVGDRVRHSPTGVEGVVTRPTGSRTSPNDIGVVWDGRDVEGSYFSENIELVEEQPNRTYYDPIQDGPSDTAKEHLKEWRATKATPVDPDHYKFPGGAEVIHISQWLTANAAQALQYVARSSRIDGKNKGDASEDIRKAITFLEFELKRLESE